METHRCISVFKSRRGKIAKKIAGDGREISMYKYEELFIKVIYLQEQDVITNSTSGENADDLGGWNNDWFTQNNG